MGQILDERIQRKIAAYETDNFPPDVVAARGYTDNPDP